MDRIYNKTPSGGDYSEIHYLDDEHHEVDKKDATSGEIIEFLADGTVINHTYFKL